MATKPREKLQQLFSAHSELDDEVCKELVSLYDRKLWHQLSLKLQELFKDPAYQPYTQDIFEGFIVDFGHKIKLLYFAHFAHDVAKSMDRDAAVALLTKHSESMKTLKGFPTAEPLLFMDMSIAEHCIDVAHMDECKERLDKGLKQLDSMADVDPVVSAAVHNVSALFCKARQDFSGYYRAALQYLSYVTVDELPEDETVALARDVSLAALLGDSIFSFAELLLHPIIKALDNTPYSWLPELLHCFSEGDMAKYDQLCRTHADQMNAQPGLVLAQTKLKQKITLMCLVAMVSSLPPEKRRLSLQHIATRTQLDVDGAEFLLMRAMSLELVAGKIDEIDASVDIRHVAPRVLTMPEIASLKSNVEGWITKVDGAAALLADEGVTAVEAAAA